MNAILGYLEANVSKFLDDLDAYVHFPSISTQPTHRADLASCADWLMTHCQCSGLNARLVPTRGNPVVLATTRTKVSSRKQHYLVYGHYDVQPPEPLESWISPPFQLTRDGDALRARGTSDNKGQHLAHIAAVEAYLKTGSDLPVDVTFVVEGEEEIGSSSFADFLDHEARNLRCDGVVISDTTIPSLDLPGVACSLRGLVSASVRITGPNQELHSGIHGGLVENPAVVLCSLLAACRGLDGHIALPGFYEAVRLLTEDERSSLDRIPFDAAAYARFIGVSQLGGDASLSPIERTTACATFEINGLASGYQGTGIKTIIPSFAEAKVSLRLVADQNPEQVFAALCAYLRSLCPPSVQMEITPGFSSRPYAIPTTHPLVSAGLNALRRSFGVEPVLLREGVTIPVVDLLRERLAAETLLLGLALPDDGMHAPNEKFSLTAFTAGMKMSAYLWPELAATLASSR